MAKDLFSTQSAVYAKYRPTYPKELYDYILSFVKEKNIAWDCATGNGQAAIELASYFKEVEATDISEAQLSNAVEKDNIHYQQCPADATPFPANKFDLITVATAYHWFDWKAFKKEADRVGRNEAVIAIWAYNLLVSTDNSINEIIQYFYHDVVGQYWDPGRRFIENEYATVEFNFPLLPTKSFEITLEWNKEQFTGYIESWSAVQGYIKQNNTSPMPLLHQSVEGVWETGTLKSFRFPLFLKLGRIVK